MPCPLCESLPEEIEVSYEEGAPEETLPHAASRLTCPRAALFEVGVRQCPGCGDYFLHRSHVPGGSEDYARRWHVETLRRTSLGAVLKAVRAEIRASRRANCARSPWVDSLARAEAELTDLLGNEA
jgi:hypothetical protein